MGSVVDTTAPLGSSGAVFSLRNEPTAAAMSELVCVATRAFPPVNRPGAGVAVATTAGCVLRGRGERLWRRRRG